MVKAICLDLYLCAFGGKILYMDLTPLMLQYIPRVLKKPFIPSQ